MPLSRVFLLNYRLHFWQIIALAVLSLLLTFFTSFLFTIAISAQTLWFASALLFVSPGLLLGLITNWLIPSTMVFITFSFVGNIIYLYAMLSLYRYLKILALKENIISNSDVAFTLALYYFSLLGIMVLGVFLQGEI